MPKGNPKNIIDLNTRRTPAERKKAASKAGKASGIARANYASLKECFKHRMTDEMMEKAFDKLWEMFIKDGNLNAADMIIKLLDEQSEITAKNITISFASAEMEEYGD